MTIALLIATLLSSVVALYFFFQLKGAEIETKALKAERKDDVETIFQQAKRIGVLQADLAMLRATAARRPVSAVEGVLGRIGGWLS